MAERLFPGDFDRLAIVTWDLARASMSDLLEVSLADSCVKGEINFENYCVEPEVIVEDPARIFTEGLPRNLNLTISEKEVYRGNEDFILHSFKTICLDTKRRTKLYRQGTIVFDSAGRTITPLASAPSLHGLNAKEKATWRESLESSIDRFGHDEAERFILIARLALESVTND